LLTRVGRPTCQITWTASPVKDAAGQLLGVLASVCCHPPEPDWKSMLGLAHDFRTPMQALTLLLTVLENPKLPEAQQREALENVRLTAHRALEIGTHLLEWTTSAAQRGRGVEPAWFPLHPLLKQLAAEQSVAAQRKGLTLTTRLAEVEGWEVYTDRVRLGRLLANLLVNAVRYTQMGTVEFAAGWRPDPAGAVLELSIIDTGVGISAEEQESIFQLGTRGRAGMEDSSGELSSGSGLGLAVVDQLKEELGLTLEVYSEYGRGSTFHLLLPPSLLRKAPRPHDTDVSIQTAKMKP
jgi:signal transduction histidine kinase